MSCGHGKKISRVGGTLPDAILRDVAEIASAQIQSHDSAHPCEDRPESGIEPMGGEPSV